MREPEVGKMTPRFSKAAWLSWVALNTGSAFRETQRGPRPLGRLAVEKTGSPLKLLGGLPAGPVVKSSPSNRELCSVLCGSLDARGVWG